LEAAYKAMGSARARFKELEATRSLKLSESPDGEFAYRKALRADTDALVEYSRILRLTTDLLLKGKVPDEE